MVPWFSGWYDHFKGDLVLFLCGGARKPPCIVNKKKNLAEPQNVTNYSQNRDHKKKKNAVSKYSVL